MSVTLGLTSAFSSTYPGVLQGAEAEGALEAALADGFERGRAAWPSVTLEASAFAAYLGERAPTDGPPSEWLSRLHVDLYLACALCQGSTEAIRAFDTA